MANFTIGELSYSATAENLGINNSPDTITRVHLTETIRLLECIRAEWGKYCESHKLGNPAIRISSGYRSPELNKAVGGEKTLHTWQDMPQTCSLSMVIKMSLRNSSQMISQRWVMLSTKSLSRSRKHPDGCTWAISVRTASKEDNVSH